MPWGWCKRRLSTRKAARKNAKRGGKPAYGWNRRPPPDQFAVLSGAKDLVGQRSDGSRSFAALRKTPASSVCGFAPAMQKPGKSLTCRAFSLVAGEGLEPPTRGL